MIFRLFNTSILAVLLVTPQMLLAQTPLSLNKAIELAFSHDPRVEEKEAFVRQAQGLLAEAEGSAGFRYGVDTFLALTPNVEGGFFENGQDSCTSDCAPRDDVFDIDDGISVWGGLTFSIIKPLATFGRLESYQNAAQHNILIKHCAGKTMPQADRYVRIASRTMTENHILVEALRSIFSGR